MATTLEIFKAGLDKLAEQRDADRERERMDLLERKGDMKTRFRAFQKRAEHTLVDIIEPRLKLLTGYFQDVNFEKAGTQTGLRAVFNTDRNFAATVWLEFSQNLQLDDNLLRLQYRLEILPIFFEFERTSEVTCSLNEVDDSSLITFVESRLMEFMKIYMRLEQAKAYQQA